MRHPVFASTSEKNISSFKAKHLALAKYLIKIYFETAKKSYLQLPIFAIVEKLAYLSLFHIEFLAYKTHAIVSTLHIR